MTNQAVNFGIGKTVAVAVRASSIVPAQNAIALIQRRQTKLAHRALVLSTRLRSILLVMQELPERHDYKTARPRAPHKRIEHRAPLLEQRNMVHEPKRNGQVARRGIQSARQPPICEECVHDVELLIANVARLARRPSQRIAPVNRHITHTNRRNSLREKPLETHIPTRQIQNGKGRSEGAQRGKTPNRRCRRLVIPNRHRGVRGGGRAERGLRSF